jgi:molybdopterin-binding protein
MNKLNAIIRDIHSSGGVTLVDLGVENSMLSAMLIDTPQKPIWLEKDKQVNIVFKENDVSLAKNLSGIISTRNMLNCRVKQIQEGDLISLVTLDFVSNIIQAAITTRALHHLELKLGDDVIALIKANELTLMGK